MALTTVLRTNVLHCDIVWAHVGCAKIGCGIGGTRGVNSFSANLHNYARTFEQTGTSTLKS